MNWLAATHSLRADNGDGIWIIQHRVRRGTQGPQRNALRPLRTPASPVLKITRRRHGPSTGAHDYSDGLRANIRDKICIRHLQTSLRDRPVTHHAEIPPPIEVPESQCLYLCPVP